MAASGAHGDDPGGMRPMPVPPPRSIDAFVDRVEVQDGPFAWDGAAAAPILAHTLVHSERASRIEQALRPRPRSGPCHVLRFGLGQRRAGRTSMRRHDIAVRCAASHRQARAVQDPVLIVPVLSVCTAGIDRGVKRIGYAGLPSLAGAIMLAQDVPVAVICDRAGGFAERQEHLALEPSRVRPAHAAGALQAGLVDAA